MTHLEKLTSYLDSKLIQYGIEEGLVHIGDSTYSIVNEESKIFDDEMLFLPNTKESVNGFYISIRREMVYARCRE